MSDPRPMVRYGDGDTSTVWEADRYLCAEFDEKNYFLTCEDEFGNPGTANIILGSLYFIDRIRIVSGLNDPSKIVQAARIFMAPSMPVVSVTRHPVPFLPFVTEVRDNRDQVSRHPDPGPRASGVCPGADRRAQRDLGHPRD